MTAEVMGDHVHLMVQTSSEEGAMYVSPIHTARLVTEWFDGHESEVEHLL